MASTFPSPETFILIICITLPYAHPRIKASITYFQPRNNPAAAISLTSPPPIPLPLLTRNIIRSSKLTAKKPITYSYHTSLCTISLTSPRQAIKTLIPKGISKVLKSIMLSTKSAENKNDTKIMSIERPYTHKLTSHNNPLAASIRGYWTDIFSPHFLHLPLRKI